MAGPLTATSTLILSRSDVMERSVVTIAATCRRT